MMSFAHFAEWSFLVKKFPVSLCDDIEVDVDVKEERVIEVRNACQIGTRKFFSSNPSTHRYEKPLIKDNGSFKEVSWDEALACEPRR